MPHAEKLTTQDIARLVEASKAPVSRVLYQHPSVRSETGAHVSRIAQERACISPVTMSGLAGGKTRWTMVVWAASGAP
jgi:DNA-binding LacI/PurR family transcriptional regulator